MRQSNEEITNVITELTGKNEKEDGKDPITDAAKNTDRKKTTTNHSVIISIEWEIFKISTEHKTDVL